MYENFHILTLTVQLVICLEFSFHEKQITCNIKVYKIYFVSSAEILTGIRNLLPFGSRIGLKNSTRLTKENDPLSVQASNRGNKMYWGRFSIFHPGVCQVSQRVQRKFLFVLISLGQKGLLQYVPLSDSEIHITTVLSVQELFSLIVLMHVVTCCNRPSTMKPK